MMMPILSYLFAFLAVAGAIALVLARNPVASAMSMVASFVGMAALFISMNAYFVGIVQILVYAGAIMVLFLFIIMLLDLKSEEKRRFSSLALAVAIFLPLLLMIQLNGVLGDYGEPVARPEIVPEAAAGDFASDSKIAQNLNNGRLPDVHLVGHTLFTGFNFPLQIMGILLMIATVGVVVVSRTGSAPSRKTKE